MKSKEINPEENYNDWNPKRLEELQTAIIATNVGETLEFENDNLKVWSITLKPSEKLPFHKHTNNYQWTCLSFGKAVSHYGTGSIVEITYQKGDTSYYDFDTKGGFVHDLENVGKTILKFFTIEFK